MTVHELLCNTNEEIFRGKIFQDSEKQKIAKIFLSSAGTNEEVSIFREKVCYGDPDGGKYLYPGFFIPPYNGGKKLRLITGELPKTHILSSNHYELEILRVLALWDKDNPKVQYMLDETIKRLSKACFAQFCPEGECTGTGVSALRFLSVLNPQNDNDKWINKILMPLIERFNLIKTGTDAIKLNMPTFYFYASLPDISNQLCHKLAENKKEWLIANLTKGWLTGTKPNTLDSFSISRKYVLKNVLAMLPEYEYIKEREIYISGKDNRCYFDISKNLL
jgi:hypothetical protein